MPSYQLLVPHQIAGRLYDQGEIIDDSTGPTAGWIPTIACTPLDAGAIATYFANGPWGLSGADSALDFGFGWTGANRFVGAQGINARAVFWQRRPGTTIFDLISNGSVYGTVQGA